MSNRNDNILNYKSVYSDGTDVLTNKLGINDLDSLNKAERMLTGYKLAKLFLDPGEQTFDVEHYKRIHKFLFEEIYPFAGEFRKENISKKIPFCLVQFIPNMLEDTLRKARKEAHNIHSREELLKFITTLYSDLDVIHPFREGNGRTEREFLRQFIDYICKLNGLEEYNLDYNRIEDVNGYIDAVVKADALLDYSDLMLLLDSILLVKEKELKTGLKI